MTGGHGSSEKIQCKFVCIYANSTDRYGGVVNLHPHLPPSGCDLPVSDTDRFLLSLHLTALVIAVHARFDLSSELSALQRDIASLEEEDWMIQGLPTTALTTTHEYISVQAAEAAVQEMSAIGVRPLSPELVAELKTGSLYNVCGDTRNVSRDVSS